MIDNIGQSASGLMKSLLTCAPLLGPVLAALVAIVGFGITHTLTSRRDISAEKRKVRISFMIEAYRKLESGSCRGPNAAKYSEAFHSALADIQLLGSPTQVAIARKMASALGTGTGEPVTINELLNALREELRSELNLPKVSDQLVILRSPEELGPSGPAQRPDISVKGN